MIYILNHLNGHIHCVVTDEIIPTYVCVFVQGKETTEEEDEVAVGMEKGFMDEFFEQVCSLSLSFLFTPLTR